MSAKTSDGKRSHGTFWGVFVVLGILMAIASVISLVQKWTGIEIVFDIAHDALSIYRQGMAALKFALFDWWLPNLAWHLTVPIWCMDAIALWFLMATGLLRANHVYKNSKTASMLNETYRAALGEVKKGKDSGHSRYLKIIGPPVSIFGAIFLTPIELLKFLSNISFKFYFYFFHVIWNDDERLQRFSDIYWKMIGDHMKTLFVLLIPFVAATCFFIWNAIQITPA